MYLSRYAFADSGLGAPSPILPAAGSAVAVTGGLITAAGGAALFGPVGAVVGAGLALLGVLGVGGGCGESCIAASNDANAVELALKANLAAFLNGQINQATAIANFNALWLQLEEGCAQIGGSAGQSCISDRQTGACKWETSPGGWDPSTCTYTAPGATGSGTTCWNWDVGYHSPIADAPSCFLDSSAGAGTSAISGANFGALPGWVWFLVGGLVVAEVFS
jgi:hypothetical protein